MNEFEYRILLNAIDSLKTLKSKNTMCRMLYNKSHITYNNTPDKDTRYFCCVLYQKILHLGYDVSRLPVTVSNGMDYTFQKLLHEYYIDGVTPHELNNLVKYTVYSDTVNAIATYNIQLMLNAIKSRHFGGGYAFTKTISNTLLKEIQEWQTKTS